MLSIELHQAAARTAYLAAFHAAQALIFEHTGKVAKTHSSVRSEFHRVASGYPQFGYTERTFLGTGYELKTIADYGVGPEAVISRDEAVEAIATARRSVAITRQILGTDQSPYRVTPVALGATAMVPSSYRLGRAAWTRTRAELADVAIRQRENGNVAVRDSGGAFCRRPATWTLVFVVVP